VNDVEPRLHTTVIREMIRHENDVTNHRIMWLFVAQLSDLLEPCFTLPSLLILAWLFALLQDGLRLGTLATLLLSGVLVIIMLSGLCLLWVRVEGRTEEEIKADS